MQLRRKLMLDASGKYLVGQEISPRLEARPHRLGDHFVVEHEIVGAGEERQLRENLPAPCAVTRVIFAELAAHQQVLECREQPVGNIFVARHAAGESAAAEDSRGEDGVIMAGRDHPRHRGDEPRRILVIGV